MSKDSGQTANLNKNEFAFNYDFRKIVGPLKLQELRSYDGRITDENSLILHKIYKVIETPEICKSQDQNDSIIELEVSEVKEYSNEIQNMPIILETYDDKEPVEFMEYRPIDETLLTSKQTSSLLQITSKICNTQGSPIKENDYTGLNSLGKLNVCKDNKTTTINDHLMWLKTPDKWTFCYVMPWWEKIYENKQKGEDAKKRVKTRKRAHKRREKADAHTIKKCGCWSEIS